MTHGAPAGVARQASGGVPREATCGRCRHRVDDRARLEATIAGLASFGSAYGESVGDSRLCVRLDRLVSPRDTCARFEARPAGDRPHG